MPTSQTFWYCNDCHAEHTSEKDAFECERKTSEVIQFKKDDQFRQGKKYLTIVGVTITPYQHKVKYFLTHPDANKKDGLRRLTKLQSVMLTELKIGRLVKVE